MQAETLNMMTKYQFVFTKIEASVKTVLNSNKMRQLRMKQKAFDRLKKNAVTANRRINVNSQLIFLKMKSNIGVQILARYQQSRQRNLQKAFQNWKIHSETLSTVKKLKTFLNTERDLQLKEKKSAKQDLKQK